MVRARGEPGLGKAKRVLLVAVVAWPLAGCWGYRVLSGAGQEKADKHEGY